MKRRDEDASITSADTLTGQCPRCGWGTTDFFACSLCSDRGLIDYPARFSAADDERLRDLILQGRPIPFVALSLSPPRPIAAINARIAQLGIVSPRGEGEPYIKVGVFMTKE